MPAELGPWTVLSHLVQYWLWSARSGQVQSEDFKLSRSWFGVVRHLANVNQRNHGSQGYENCLILTWYRKVPRLSPKTGRLWGMDLRPKMYLIKRQSVCQRMKYPRAITWFMRFNGRFILTNSSLCQDRIQNIQNI